MIAGRDAQLPQEVAVGRFVAGEAGTAMAGGADATERAIGREQAQVFAGDVGRANQRVQQAMAPGVDRSAVILWSLFGVGEEENVVIIEVDVGQKEKLTTDVMTPVRRNLDCGGGEFAPNIDLELPAVAGLRDVDPQIEMKLDKRPQVHRELRPEVGIENVDEATQPRWRRGCAKPRQGAKALQLLADGGIVGERVHIRRNDIVVQQAVSTGTERRAGIETAVGTTPPVVLQRRMAFVATIAPDIPADVKQPGLADQAQLTKLSRFFSRQ